MQPSEIIKILSQLGIYIKSPDSQLNKAIINAHYHNSWFTEKNIKRALISIANNYLDEDKLAVFLNKYPNRSNSEAKVIGVVSAGNIPLVSFHDILCILISGHYAKVKLSEKDKILLPFLADKICELDEKLGKKIIFIDRLKDFDAVIATGSNNTARYFEYYFGKYPNIIRKNRNSIGVLTGNESLEELKGFGDDILAYFGLGCRNVSKIYVPEQYDFEKLKTALNDYQEVGDHYHYKNNLDYNRTLLMMNKVPFLNIDYINILENEAIASPISNLHYEIYSSIHKVETDIQANKDQIQCVVSNENALGNVRFGQSQTPQLENFADDMDTMNFLKQL